MVKHAFKVGDDVVFQNLIGRVTAVPDFLPGVVEVEFHSQGTHKKRYLNVRHLNHIWLDNPLGDGSTEDLDLLEEFERLVKEGKQLPLEYPATYSKCTCGADSVKAPYHSNWCDKV